MSASRKTYISSLSKDFRRFELDESLDFLDLDNYIITRSKVDDPNDPYPGSGVGGICKLASIGEKKTQLSWTFHAKKLDPDPKKGKNWQ